MGLLGGSKGEMMRGLKKAVVAVLATALAFALAVPALATQTQQEQMYSVYINNTSSGHTYEAYQIFSGKLTVENNEKTLSNMQWGEGVSDDVLEDFGPAEEKAAKLETAGGAEAFAKAVAPFLTNSSGSTNEAVNGQYVIDDLEPGYYLIKDQDGSLSNADAAYTSFILAVVGDVEVSPKSLKPTVGKKVQNGANTLGGYSTIADYNLFESFTYELTATIPADEAWASYDSYTIRFNESMSSGITFESIASVTLNGKAINIATDAEGATGYLCTAERGQDGGTWTLTINDLKGLAEGMSGELAIKVIYNAHLNGNAVNDMKSAGFCENSVTLAYSNNPNDEQSFGKTVEVKSYVFTYKMINKKVEGSADGKALAGAGFKLYAKNSDTPILLMKVQDGLYRVAQADEKGAVEEIFSAPETGSFDVFGLDAGEYVLKETTTPDGYNTCADALVKIEAGPEVKDGIGVANAKLYVDGSNEFVNEVVVVNERGALLPSTGGMGTFGIYAAGLVLLLGAGFVFLRNHKEDSN